MPPLACCPVLRRIQFDRRELGVELVRDSDIMPADPAENLPPSLLAANPLLLLNGRYVVGGEPGRGRGLAGLAGCLAGSLKFARPCAVWDTAVSPLASAVISHSDPLPCLPASLPAGQPVRPPAPRTIFPLAFSSLPAVTPAAAAAAYAQRPAQQQQQQAQQTPLPVPLAAAQQQQQIQQTPLQVSPPEASTAPTSAGPSSVAPSSVGPAAPDSSARAAVSAAEAQALSELAVNLDKKEALLVQVGSAEWGSREA